MATWLVVGTVTVDVEVEVEAETLEEAIDFADSNVSMEEYANETVGAYDSSGEAEVRTMCSAGWIEWDEKYCEEV